MSNAQLKVFKEAIQRFGISRNDHLASKSLEIQELIKAKSGEILKHINDNARVVLCIHISCELLNIPIETTTNELIKMSSLSKAQYNKHRKVILKILDLNKKVTIDEIIRKLGITHAVTVEKSAKAIFKVYMEQQSFENQDVDPSVYVMSVYFACKAENVKIAKKNILTLSNLTQGQFSLMEKAWEKWTPTVVPKGSNKENKKSLAESIVSSNQGDTAAAAAVTHRQKQSEETEESYTDWAKRILDQAHRELKRAK